MKCNHVRNTSAGILTRLHTGVRAHKKRGWGS